jgi:hypothetical protein
LAAVGREEKIVCSFVTKKGIRMCGRGVSIKCWVCWVALACSAMGVVVTGAEIERSASVSPVPADVQVHKVASAKPRNVVFILSDDHRYDAMSFLGHQFA